MSESESKLVDALLARVRAVTSEHRARKALADKLGISPTMLSAYLADPPTALDPWDYPDELLLVVCDWHHRERQAVEQAIYAAVGKHLATLDLHDMRRQPIYTFFEEDSTLEYLPIAIRERLRYERDQD